VTELVAVYLVVALAAYVLFGGADFGGGILEATLPRGRLRRRLEATLAPVWEANHVWLIAVVVILFVGFPRFYAYGFTRLFVPISLALFAVLVRGVFFTLRKYDPDPGPFLTAVYSVLFRFSSVMAPFCFGTVVGGLLTVHPGTPGMPPSGESFGAVYVAPWLHPFGLLCGLFVAALFGYLASVFFHGELSEPTDRDVVWRRTVGFFAAAFLLGGAVLGTGADILYPQRNRALGERIAHEGLIVSEFALGTPPHGSNFPRRNRVISGLARGCLVDDSFRVGFSAARRRHPFAIGTFMHGDHIARLGHPGGGGNGLVWR